MAETELSEKGERTRTEMLAAAVVRFGADGLSSTSVADIARDVGVARSAPYAYFENKEDLFYQALDFDAAATIDEVLPIVLSDDDRVDWMQNLMTTLVLTIDRHPLARRVLGGLEPTITGRAMELDAIAGLRVAVGERMAAQQAAGVVRADIDAGKVSSALVTVMLALLMAIIQLGPGSVDIARLADINELVRAAIDPPA